MACLLSRFAPSRATPPCRSFTVLGGRPDPQCTDCPDQSLHFNALRQRTSHSHSIPEIPSTVLEPSCARILRVDNIPSCESAAVLQDIFLDSEGYQGCNLATYLHHPTRNIVKRGMVTFDSSDSASKAVEQLNGTLLEGLPISVSYIDFDYIPSPDLEVVDESSLWAPDDMVTEGVRQPPRKKAKLDTPIKLLCKICADEISGAHSKPCLRCKDAWCLECIKRWFTQASEDFERMYVELLILFALFSYCLNWTEKHAQCRWLDAAVHSLVLSRRLKDNEMPKLFVH